MRRGYAGPMNAFVHGADLTNCTIYLTIKARGREITKTGDELSVAYNDGVTSIAFMLSQQETLLLPEGTAEVQVRYVNADESADVTVISQFTVERVLKQGVIPYNGGYNDE